MMIVKTAINDLGGTLAMDTRPGEGTRFKIRLPLTLAIMQALIVHIDDQSFAVPQSAIHEVLRIDSRTVIMQDGNDVISYGDSVLRIVYLRRVFAIRGESLDIFHVVVTTSDFGAVGIAVDRVVGLKEIVVRSVEDSLVSVPGIAGATDLGDGRPVLILNVAAIVETLGAQRVTA
jgi:two-component system chemotaxis sensor kinase CheA